MIPNPHKLQTLFMMTNGKFYPFDMGMKHLIISAYSPLPSAFLTYHQGRRSLNPEAVLQSVITDQGVKWKVRFNKTATLNPSN